MAKFEVKVVRADGQVAKFETGSRREAERDASAMKRNFGGRVQSIDIKEKN